MKINPNIAVNENGLLFNPGTGESFTTNPLGARIIGLLKEGKSEEQIREELQQEYEVEGHTLEKDFIDFMQLLKKHSLISNDE